MTEAPQGHERLQQRGKLLVALLKRGKHEHQRSVVVWGALRILAGVAVVAFALVVSSLLAPVLPRPVGWLASAVVWGVMLALVWRHWLRPLRAIPTLAVFSRLVEERRDFRDMLRAALEFSQRGAPQGGSVDLAAATVDRAYDEAHALQLVKLFDFPHKRRDASVTGFAAAGLVLLGLLFPGVGPRALQGLWFAYPSPGSIAYGNLEVLDGDIEVLAGENVVVRVRDHGPLAPEMVLRFNDTGDLWKSRPLEPARSGAYQEYVFRFDKVQDTTAYRFESGKRRSAEHRIAVVQRPIVSRFGLRLVPPAYTRNEPVILEENRGDAIALRGTRVEISGTSSRPLRRGFLVSEGEHDGAVTLPEPLPLGIESEQFNARFTLRSNLRYHFELRDELDHTNGDPVTYQLTVLDDRPPYVELRSPAGDADIPKALQVTLLVYASDDFGVSQMRLMYQRERQGEPLDATEQVLGLELHDSTALDPEGQPLGKTAPREVIKTCDWNLSDLELYPGDAIAYSIEVEDNDEYSGHKKARTPIYRLRLPTLSELYTQIEAQDESRMTEMDDVLEKGREVQEKFEQLARELKKNPEMDWKKEQDIDRAIDKQKELSKKVEEMGDKLQQEVDRMEEQNLLGAEIAEKMEEIRNLMQDVQDKTMREYMERLQEAMKQISPEEIQRAMEEMQLSQEEFLKRLERTKSLLEQIRREQKLDSMVERVSELLHRQEELSDQTEKLDTESKPESGQKKNKPEDKESKQDSAGDKKSAEPDAKQPQAEKQPADDNPLEQLSEEQKKLAEQSQQLESELDKLAQEFEQQNQPELSEPNESMQQQQPSEEMREAARQLQQQNKQNAQQKQENAEKRLRSLYEQLMDAQMAMSMAMQMQVGETLQKAARQSLDVSFRQEALARHESAMLSPEEGGETARSQQSLKDATGKVVEGLDELGKKSLQVPPQITALLGQAMQMMEEGVDAYEKGNAVAGRVRGEEAYAQLNRVVIELNRSSQACSGGGSGGKPSQEKMQQSMEQQQRLNDATRQFAERLPNPGNLSPEERAEMSRLLGEQQSVQQQLQDIERNAAEQRDLLGRLDKMQDEMQEVIEDMESEAVSDETLRAQERIVSRMLQAQRSVNKRDRNKERESRTAEEIFSKGGGALNDDNRRQKLRRDIERALESGTPEEYEELVRQYFRAIAEADEAAQPVP